MKCNALRWLACLLPIAVTACVTTDGGVPHHVASGAQFLVMVPIAPPHYRAGAAYGGGYDRQFGSNARHKVANDIAQAQNLEVLAEWPMPALGVDCFLMGVATVGEIDHVLQAVTRDKRVAWAQALHTYHALGHNDPLFPLQPSAAAWHLAEAHAFTTGRDVSVAVVDSGVELSHPDLSGRISVARNFVDTGPYPAERHGTAVAGIIAANADNGIGIVGIAPQARLMALRACWEGTESQTTCNSFTLAQAIQFALENHAQVINLSLSGPEDVLLSRLLDAAQSARVAVVCAADSAVADGGFPASHPGVIVVVSDDASAIADAVLAPGNDIPATLPGATWGFVSGSSFAAAQISGVLALLLDRDRSLAPQQARERLLSGESAVKAGRGTARQTRRPSGVCKALARAVQSCTCACTTGPGDALVLRH